MNRICEWFILSSSRNAELKSDKNRLAEIEDLLTEERGELVATANILDEDEKLRTTIQEEERAKAKEVIDKELAEAKKKLDEERNLLRYSWKTMV